jgi:hypothetical protein
VTRSDGSRCSQWKSCTTRYVCTPCALLCAWRHVTPCVLQLQSRIKIEVIDVKGNSSGLDDRPPNDLHPVLQVHTHTRARNITDVRIPIQQSEIITSTDTARASAHKQQATEPHRPVSCGARNRGRWHARVRGRRHGQRFTSSRYHK